MELSLNDPVNELQTVAERIKQRRSQMLVHSYIYYELDHNIVSDHQWQAWANELRDLQLVYGWRIDWYDKDFKDWDGSTGCHLPKDNRTISIARKLLKQQMKV